MTDIIQLIPYNNFKKPRWGQQDRSALISTNHLALRANACFILCLPVLRRLSQQKLVSLMLFYCHIHEYLICLSTK